MIALRALLYAVIVFVALGVIAMVVAVIMRLMYTIVHRGEKKAKAVNNAEGKVNPGNQVS